MVLSIALLAANFAYEQGGQLGGSDMLSYMDIGLRGDSSVQVINRYVHIYALRTASLISSGSLQGLQLFSAVAAGVTVLLAYYSARSMSNTPQIIRGLVAIAILLNVPVIVNLLLAPKADTSAMIAVLTLTAIYIRSAKNHHRNPWMLRLLGLALFLAFKTKETTLVWSLTLIGLGITDTSQIELRILLRKLWILLQGILAGAAILAIANWALLDDPFFGLRPSDYLGYRAIWESVSVQRTDPVDLITNLILPTAGIAFTLYVVAGLWASKDIPLSARILWLVPLALLILLTATVNRITSGIVPRHYLPAFALISVLAAQIAGARLPRETDRRLAILLLGGSIAIIGLVGVIGLAVRSTWTFPSYFEAILAPVTLAIALGLILMFPYRRRLVELPVLFCILIVTIYPIRVNLPEIAREHPLLRPNARFDPILSFGEELRVLDDSTLFVGLSIVPYLHIDTDPNEVRGLFNVSLDARNERDSYKLGAVDAVLIEDLVSGEYDYVLITTNDWDWMRESAQDSPEWREQYLSTLEPSGRFVLLTKIGSE